MEWLEARLPGATVCFTTRRGGLSVSPWHTLNLGILTGDERGTVLKNRARAASALGIDGHMVRVGLQVHGASILSHDGHGQGRFLAPVEEPPEADGHVTDRPGLPLAVLAADCLPVAIRGPRGLAMLHCGWRGLASPLIEDAVRMVGGEDAVIGPGIGPCCYEVGPDVREAFCALGESVFDGHNCDLPEIATRILSAAGVERVEVSGICTSCEADDFFSHRRDSGATGRQAGIAWIG